MPPRKKPDPKPILAECGYSGLKETGGRILEEFQTELKGEKFKKWVREAMSNEPFLAAPYFLIEILLRNTPRSWKANDSGHPDAERARDFAASCWNDMESTPQEILTNAATAVPWGYAVLETTFKIRRGKSPEPRLNSAHDDGMYGWRDWAPRSQDSLYEWQFSDEGRVLGMWQQVEFKSGKFFIPIDRMLHFKFRGNKHNPEGFSCFRPAYTSSYYAKRHRAIEGIVIERVGAGFVVVRLPPDVMHPNADAASKSIRTGYETAARKIRIDEIGSIVMPAKSVNGKETGYDIELLSASGRGALDSDPIIKRYEVGMLTAFLSQFLAFGTQDTGSLALSSNMTSLLGFAVGAFNMTVDEEINRHAVPDLMELNGFHPDAWPSIQSADVETPSLVEAGGFLSQMIGSGAMEAGKDLDDWARKQIGLEPKPELSTDDMLGAAMGDEAPTDIEPEPETPGQLSLPLTQEAPPDMLTLDEAADELRIDPSRIRRAIRSGSLKGARIGREVRIRRADLESMFGGE